MAEVWRQKIENQELSFSEFSRREIVLKSRPSKATIELTKNCNFKCLMCTQSLNPYLKDYRREYNMKAPTLEKIANQVFGSLYFVDFGGIGEPTFHPAFSEILAILKNHPHINWHMLTNLSLNNTKALEEMMRLGFMLGVSVDGSSQKVYEQVRINGNFKLFRKNLETIASEKKVSGKGHIYLVTVIQKHNISELAEIVRLASEFQIPEVQFKNVQRPQEMTDIFFQQNIQCDPQDLRVHVDRALDVALDLGVRITLNDQPLLDLADPQKYMRAKSVPFKSEPRLNFPQVYENSWRNMDKRVQGTSKVCINQKCYKPFHYVYFTPEGQVSPCNHLPSPVIVEMGHIDHQSFEEIWNGPKYQQFRKDLLSANPQDFRCQWCFAHRLED